MSYKHLHIRFFMFFQGYEPIISITGIYEILSTFQQMEIDSDYLIKELSLDSFNLRDCNLRLGYDLSTDCFKSAQFNFLEENSSLEYALKYQPFVSGIYLLTAALYLPPELAEK
jgi:hypothetical protein